MLKLNLGSGKLKIKGYENIDKMYGADAYPLQYESETVDEIRASHLLEHFGRREVKAVLKDWIDKLRPGGVLKIAVPGIDKLQEARRDGVKLPCSDDAYIFGGQTDENDFHKSMFDTGVLTTLLKDAGLQDIKPWESDLGDCASLPVSLNLEGTKPGGKIMQTQAIMSMPRLAFTDNMFCAIKAFGKIGIPFRRGTGVFWGQVLTRLMELHQNDGTEYIITVDYDTWFKEEHVLRLLQLMQENPEVDAIVPLQIKREDEVAMFSVIDTDTAGIKKVPVTELDEELVPICNGHFGLTIFRVSAFEGLKKPWFHAHPNEDGEWGEGRIDEDIHFWHNFHQCGKVACLAPEISIGHIQLKCTFPGPAKRAYKPVEYRMSQMDKGQYGEHCVPKVELMK